MAQGAKKADQEKAAELAKSTEEERVAAEKASEIENAKAAAAEQERNQAEAQAASGIAKAENPQDDGAKLAALSQPSPAGPSKAELSQNIQSELRRVGCYTGSASSEWTAAARQSLVRFNQSLGLKLDVNNVSTDTLEAVKRRSTRVCPLACEHGFRVDGERCVKIVCRAGSVLNDDNECESKRAPPPRQAKPARREPAQAAASTVPPDRVSQREICKRRCQDVRAACNARRGGYFNGCGMEASACTASCN